MQIDIRFELKPKQRPKLAEEIATALHIGDAIQVAYEEGSIHISLASPAQSEPAMVCDTKARYASK